MMWVERAACQGLERLFFGHEGELRPERETREAEAQAVCISCPVREQCLDYALRESIRDGIWGGLNDNHRTRELHRRNRRAIAA